MHISAYILPTALCLISSVSALIRPNNFQTRANSTTALPPSEDPWYTAPDDLLSYPLGSIIRVRPDPLHLYASIGTNYTSASYNILYRTSDSNGIASFAVTTLFVPSVKSGSSKSPGLLSYQIPYDSSWVDASPSWALLTEFSDYIPDLMLALQEGWYLSVPDYEGPNAAFGVGLTEGYAVLDGLRAVTQSPSSPATAGSNISSSAQEWKISLWGYSGGSIGSEFAAELQASYAPEINIAGIAIGGVVTPLDATLDAVNESPYAALIVLGLWGYSNVYPIVESYLLDRLTPEVKASGNYTMGRNMSFDEALLTYADQDIYSYFVDGRSDIQSNVFVDYFYTAQATMGLHGLPNMPMFVYKAIGDQLSPIEHTDALIKKYCEAGQAEIKHLVAAHGSGNGTEEGVRIWYERNRIGGHVAEETNGNARAFEFLLQAMNGKLSAGWPNGAGEGCVVRNVTVGNDTSPDW